MIHSMTGFAAGTRATPLGQLSVELRSLNHRYAEVSVRLPEELRAAEPRLRELAAARVRRGKLEISARLRGERTVSGELRLNRPLAEELARLAAQARAIFPDAGPPELTSWLAWPGVVEAPEADLEPLQEALVEAVAEGLEELLAYRRREGGKLAGMLRERLAGIERISGEVRGWLPEIRERAAERLQERIATLSESPLDPGRLEQEVALLLQRLDVDEELDRLDAHRGEVERALESRKPVGRRLDFLMQELNREANTLGSKAVDGRLSQASVELKVLIEQMREQVQNIE